MSDSTHCGAHGCIFGHPGGQGNNGGCRCLRDLSAPDRVELQRKITALRKRAEGWESIAAQREKLQADLKLWSEFSDLQGKLLVCFRLNKFPSNKTLDRLGELRDQLMVR